MRRIPTSRAASALLRALVARADVADSRILLSSARSVDWQSLTFTGERHILELRVLGPSPEGIVDRLTGGIEDADFPMPGQFVADIVVFSAPEVEADGSIRLAIEALTIDE
jgi:hypothetical protein